jgi:hypothetical protein
MQAFFESAGDSPRVGFAQNASILLNFGEPGGTVPEFFEFGIRNTIIAPDSYRPPKTLRRRVRIRTSP